MVETLEERGENAGLRWPQAWWLTDVIRFRVSVAPTASGPPVPPSTLARVRYAPRERSGYFDTTWASLRLPCLRWSSR